MIRSQIRCSGVLCLTAYSYLLLFGPAALGSDETIEVIRQVSHPVEKSP